jgi:hypothetical protein
MTLEQNDAINDQQNSDPGQPDPAQKQGTTPRMFTQDEANAFAAEAKREAVKRFADYDTLKQQIGTFSQEKETLTGNLAKAAERANSAVLELAFYKAASEAGFIKPDHAFVMSDKSKVTIGEDGTISGVSELVIELAQNNPHFLRSEPVKPGAPKVSATNPGGSPSLTADALKGMSVQDINALPWDTVKAALKNPK